MSRIGCSGPHDARMGLPGSNLSARRRAVGGPDHVGYFEWCSGFVQGAAGAVIIIMNEASCFSVNCGAIGH